MFEDLLPPYDYILLVAKNCPECLQTYFCIWQDQNHENKISYDKKVITEIKNFSWTKFKNNIRILASEGLCEYTLNDTLIDITLAGYEIDAEGFSLC